jgi:hypothetical protein
MPNNLGRRVTPPEVTIRMAAPYASKLIYRSLDIQKALQYQIRKCNKRSHQKRHYDKPFPFTGLSLPGGIRAVYVDSPSATIDGVREAKDDQNGGNYARPTSLNTGS